MAKSKLRAVIVGCGGMSNTWLRAATATPGLTLVGLVDMQREAAEKRAQEYQLGPEVVFDNLRDALRKTQPDMVFDVTVPEAHDAVAIEALRAGCHVLGEKPMSVSLPRARKMVATAEQAERLYAVIQNRRYEPNIRRVRKVIQGRKLGRVEEVHADFFLGAHFGGFRDLMDYPLILDMAIHTFDQARYMSGADPVAVYCHSFNPSRSWYKGDASAIAIFEMSDGLVFSYRGSWCAEGHKTDWNADWRVIGAKGTLTWDGGENVRAQVVEARAKPAFLREVKDCEMPALTLEHQGHAGLIREFVQCVRTGKTPLTDCHDNIKSLAMVLAAVQSARQGRRVQVKW